MKFYTYCIWDFNGTILDDVELGMNSVNALLKEQGLTVIESREAYRKKFDFPIINYYKMLGFDFSKLPYDLIAEQWVALYMKNLKTAPLFEGVVEALDFFEKRGVRQTVISASERKMLRGQLDGLGISNRFEEILGIDNIYGDSKLSIARAWRERHPNERVMFIGDTTHDCQTAQILGADCFIVCNGHQSPDRFDGLGVPVFATLDELTAHLDKM